MVVVFVNIVVEIEGIVLFLCCEVGSLVLLRFVGKLEVFLGLLVILDSYVRKDKNDEYLNFFFFFK